MPDPDAGRSAKRKRIAKDPEIRSQDILDAAMDVFTRKGVGESTVDEIAERAGVAKGTFYLYFRSKDHAVGALWEQYVNGILAIGEEVLPRDSDDRPLGDAIAEFIERLTDYGLANAELHRIVYGSANAKALELCRAVNERAVLRLTDAVVGGTQPASTNGVDHRLLVRLLYHGAHATLQDAVSGVVPLDRDQLIATFRAAAGRLLIDR